MTPALNSVVLSDALALCRELPEASVNCVVTSPPYFGLRDYGIDGQIGLEETPAAYVEKLVVLFREIWRVLRDDGTVWVNMGDTYTGHGPSSSNQNRVNGGKKRLHEQAMFIPSTGLYDAYPPKSLLGIPWRVAFALQDDGWILRSDIIWAKPNPMPESVTDRPTKSHEYIFLLTKQGDYFYDQEAVREKALEGTDLGLLRGSRAGHDDLVAWHAPSILKRQNAGIDSRTAGNGKRNLRSVWTIPTEPTPFAHFATFPRKLVERCILAGCPSRVCAKCGAPWVRVVEKRGGTIGKGWTDHTEDLTMGMSQAVHRLGDQKDGNGQHYQRIDKGLRPTCDCQSDTRPGLVFDPFMGSGTVALVARALGRDYIGCDLNPDYVKLANDRLSAPFTPPLFDLDAPAAPRAETLPLWTEAE